MNAVASVRRAFAVVVYFTTISLGAGAFAVNPVRFLLGVPVVTGAVLLGHAVKTAGLDRVAYAIVWLLAAVLAFSVVGGAAEAFVLRRDVPPLTEIPAVRVVGTFSLTAVLVAAYMRALQEK